MNQCNAKSCIHRNKFGYCMLTGYCEYPELRTFNAYDNRTNYKVETDDKINHKYPLKK